MVLLQEGRQANLGCDFGRRGQLYGKGQGRTLDAKLAKYTKVIAITFFVLVFIGMLITKFT